MSDIVIKAEGIGKFYLMGHKSNEKYTTLRDILANKTKGLWSKIRGLESRVQKNIEECRITEPAARRVSVKGRVAGLLEAGTGFRLMALLDQCSLIVYNCS